MKDSDTAMSLSAILLPLHPVYNFQDRANPGGRRPEDLFHLPLVMAHYKLPDRQFADPAVHDFRAGKTLLNAPAVFEVQSMPELPAVGLFEVVAIDPRYFFCRSAAHPTIYRF